MNDIVEIISKKNNVILGIAAAQKSIDEAEISLDLKFTDEYKKYLLNFGCMIMDGREFTGISHNKLYDVVSITQYRKSMDEDIPSDWYVIEQLNIDGIVIWQASSGEIYQTSPETEPIKLCDSLADYIEL